MLTNDGAKVINKLSRKCNLIVWKGFFEFNLEGSEYTVK